MRWPRADDFGFVPVDGRDRAAETDRRRRDRVADRERSLWAGGLSARATRFGPLRPRRCGCRCRSRSLSACAASREARLRSCSRLRAVRISSRSASQLRPCGGEVVLGLRDRRALARLCRRRAHRLDLVLERCGAFARRRAEPSGLRTLARAANNALPPRFFPRLLRRRAAPRFAAARARPGCARRRRSSSSRPRRSAV